MVGSSIASSLVTTDEPTVPVSLDLENGTLYHTVHKSIYGVLEPVKAATLNKRSRLDIIHATHLRAIVPVDIAAAGLKIFYAALLAKVEIWRAGQPVPDVSIVIGNLRLALSSATPISWDFVERFGYKMLRATFLGFTGTYTILYADAEGGQMITIDLRVIDHATGLEARSRKSRPPKQIQSALSLRASASILAHTEASIDKALRSSFQAPKRILKDKETSSKSDHESKNLLSSASTRRDLRTRTFPIFDLRSIKFRALSFLTPTMVAAQYLEDFYDLIALKIETGFWGNQGPLHYVTFERWNFQLSFSSYAQAVPWDFIYNLALEMSDYAQKGFTPIFEQTFAAETPAGHVYVNVVFKLLEGEGISGLSNSGSPK